MPSYLKHLLIAAFIVARTACYGQVFIKAGDKNIYYMGRVRVSKDSSSLYWPGSSATINFKGSGISVTLRSVKETAYFYAIIDSDDANPLKIKSDSLKETFLLFSNLHYGSHSLKLFKLTNNTSETKFYGFELEGNSAILPPLPPLKRKIEFYGNSITAGHGVDAPAGVKDAGAPRYFNNYFTYDAFTARRFNAQFSCIARSGIGVMVSWFPEIMPEIYDRLDPSDTNSKWDFSKYKPDIVVVNLFQNDSWIVNMPDNAQFKARFGTKPPGEDFIITSYQKLIAMIRNKYPRASIICALGSMDATKSGSKWPGYILQAAKNLNDKKIYTLFFPFKNTPGHPNRAEHQLMANDLIAFIDKNIKW